MKNEFWKFAHEHSLNYTDYTDLIGITLDWMRNHGVDTSGNWSAEKYLHGYIQDQKFKITNKGHYSTFEVIK